MDKIFQIPAVITKDKSLNNGSRQFTLETQENIDPEHLHRLIINEGKVGWFTFSVPMIEAQDLANLPEIDSAAFPDSKTPAQRQRAVIFLLWTAKGKKGTFDKYYIDTMERIINQLKTKLD